MKFYYITFRSVTYAQRGEKTLEKEGVRCTMLRTPKWMETKGCGYCLRLWARDAGQGVDLLRRHGVAFGKVYLQNSDGQLEEIEV